MGKIAFDEKPNNIRLGLAEIFMKTYGASGHGIGIGLTDSVTFDPAWEDITFKAGVPGIDVKRNRTSESATIKFTHPQFDVDFFSRALPGAVTASSGASLYRTSEEITFSGATSTENLDILTSLGVGNFVVDPTSDAFSLNTGGSAPDVYVEDTHYTLDRNAGTITRIAVGGSPPVGEPQQGDYAYTDNSTTSRVVRWGAVECTPLSFAEVRIHSVNPDTCVPTDIVGFKAIPTGALSIGFALAEYTKPEVTLALVADLTRAKGDRLFRVNIGGAVFAA